MIDQRNVIESGLGSPVTAWSQFEANLAPGSLVIQPQDRIASLPIPFHLVNRRVYVHREVVEGVGCTEYLIRGRLAFRRNDRIVAELPLDSAVVASGSTLIFDSAPALCSQNIAPIGQDALELQLSRRFSSADRSLLLTPTRINVGADELTFDILSIVTDAGAIEAYKIFLGVLSSA